MTLPTDKKIILFDGVCNLCNTSIQYIIKKDIKDNFRFASLDSPIGQKIQESIGHDSTLKDSIILYYPNKTHFTKAAAIFEIAKTLGGIHILILIFKIFPLKLNNLVYDYIAQNRYKWFGKNESCLLPTTDVLNKFIN